MTRTVVPNLIDYERARSEFSWQRARDRLDGLPGGRGLNIAHECVDRHATGASGSRAALRLVSRHGQVGHEVHVRRAASARRTGSRTCSSTWASSPGERVFVLTGRRLELYLAVLGALKRRAVACTLFAAFGPEPDPAAHGARGRARPGHDRRPVPTQDRSLAGRASGTPSRPARDRRRRADPYRGNAGPARTSRRRRHRLRDRTDRSRGHGAPALHERHDRHAEGCRPRARRHRGALRDRRDRARPASRRRLLVYRGPRMGDGHVLRHRGTARARRDERRRRSRVRRRTVVRHPRATNA